MRCPTSLRTVGPAALSILVAALNSTCWATDSPQPNRVVTLKGHVVWLAEALQEKHDMQSVPEAAERILALETADGHLHPLLEDKRGRSFRLDPRLREGLVELLVRQHDRSPMSQVIKIFSVDRAGHRFELDYWCEICSIAMFELKACDCCQGPIELRRRKAGPAE